MPSVLKAPPLMSPESVHAARSAEALALPLASIFKGSRPGFSIRPCSVSASSAIEAGVAAPFLPLLAACACFSSRLALIVAASLRCAPVLATFASKPGRRSVSKLPVGAALLNATSSGAAPPRCRRPLNALPLI